MSPSTSSERTGGFSAVDLVGVVLERRTYANLGYLLLAIPLGFAYGFLLVFGFVFGAILSVVGVGVAILLVAVICSRVLAGFERVLANALLDLELQRPEDARSSSKTGPWETLKRYLDAPSTWQSVSFLVLRSWIGIVALAFLFVLATVLSLATSPLRYPHEVEFVTVNSEPIAWSIETLPEALAALVVGVVAGLLFLHVMNAFAHVSGRIAVALLDEATSLEGEAGSRESESEPA
ncbi:sensor domain-containing protein [Natrarchaeobius oligotrophus]|uniref:Histidine kinase n=1 Tax=Natrarchaeobius chitinivorans TaxID=1679083 RepID=A0A3N6PQU4_NATCH|nr:sensor domain-containing protein [Natrarchaeobius chitinivorans]RQH01716.1 histidine kinase [Natrarchaeobius chitinivorans]